METDAVVRFTLLIGISITVGCEMPFVVVDIVAWLACCVVDVAWLASCCFLFKALCCCNERNIF